MTVQNLTIALRDAKNNRSSPANLPFDFLPVASTKKIWVGANANGTVNFDPLNTAAGPMMERRSFQQPSQGTPSNISATTMPPDVTAGRMSLWSFKESPAVFKTGSKDSAFRSLLASINHPTYIALYHEPGSEFRDGVFTVADWKAANNRMGDLIHQAGKSFIKSCIIPEGRWAFSTAGGFGSYDYWDAGFAETIDVIGFDQYSRSTNPNFTVEGFLSIKPATGQTWAPMAWARAKNKPVIIPEWGISDDIGQVEKAKAIHRFWDWVQAQQDIEAINYFSNNQDVASDPGATYAVHDESLQALKEIVAEARAL